MFISDFETPQDDVSLRRASKVLETFSIAQLLAFTNYISGSLATRVSREDRLAIIYSKAERCIFEFMEAQPSMPRAGTGELSVLDGSAFEALRSSLGIVDSVAFVREPLPPSGAAFGMAQWLETLKEIEVTSDLSDDSFVQATRDTMNRMPGTSRAGWSVERWAEARLLVYSASSAASSPSIDPEDFTRGAISVPETMAILTTVFARRDTGLSHPDVASHYVNVLAGQLYVSFPDVLEGDHAVAWANECSATEILLGIAAACSNAGEQQIHPELPLSVQDLFGMAVHNATRALRTIGRQVATDHFVGSVGAKSNFDPKFLADAIAQCESLHNQVDVLISGRSLRYENAVMEVGFGLN